MRLLLDEMYTGTIAEQLRARGYDVVSVHDPDYARLEGAADEEVWAAAVADNRALVSENVSDFRRIETDAIARGEPAARVIFTTDRKFPRGDPRTLGRLVLALADLLETMPDVGPSLFLRPSSAG
jgi:predicted nuclease of predicted toxin-antitoxin system